VETIRKLQGGDNDWRCAEVGRIESAYQHGCICGGVGATVSPNSCQQISLDFLVLVGLCMFLVGPSETLSWTCFLLVGPSSFSSTHVLNTRPHLYGENASMGPTLVRFETR
jgi:hypothetical protein